MLVFTILNNAALVAAGLRVLPVQPSHARPEGVNRPVSTSMLVEHDDKSTDISLSYLLTFVYTGLATKGAYQCH